MARQTAAAVTETPVQRGVRAFASAAGLLVWLVAGTAFAQKMFTLEEVTISTVAPMMAVFNNLVIFDQHVPQNTLQSIVPDLSSSSIEYLKLQ